MRNPDMSEKIGHGDLRTQEISSISISGITELNIYVVVAVDTVGGNIQRVSGSQGVAAKCFSLAMMRSQVCMKS